MSATRPLSDSASGSPATTLGDLLYGRSGKPAVPESAWVAVVRAIGEHDGKALKALYERSHRLVFTLALRIVNNRATAEEVTVDVFHEIWRRASAYDPADGSVMGWIMNLTRSRAIDRLRFEQRKKRTNSGQHVEPVCIESVEDSVNQRDHAARLQAALGVLTADERDAIELAYFSDATYGEVSRRLNVPLGTIKTRIRTGLTKLRFVLAREGIS
jgi:RNA polymerase sigma-70 factor, ECF subfamily